MLDRFETIVVGLGAMGSAALYQLAKKGNKVLGLDRFDPPHALGSTHGDTRITRLAIGEGEHYTPLAIRSQQIWRELETAPEELLTTKGGLVISSQAKTSAMHVPQFFEQTLSAARQFNIKHQTLDAKQIRQRYPQFKVRDDETGYFEFDAGFVRPEACVRRCLDLAKHYGAVTHTDEPALKFSASRGVSVTTDKTEYHADKLIITAGPWITDFVEKEYHRWFKVTRQVLAWFDVEDAFVEFTPDRFPIFIWELQNSAEGIYGFPAVDGPKGGLKLATEKSDSITTPATADRTVTDHELAEMHEKLIAPHFPQISRRCLKAKVCLYTVTPDAGFVIDYHPDHKEVIIASPCSGHGFKHSAAIGEALAELVTTRNSPIDLTPFRLARFSRA